MRFIDARTFHWIPVAVLSLLFAACSLAQAVQSIVDGESRAGAKASAYQWYAFGKARSAFRQYSAAVTDYQRASSLGNPLAGGNAQTLQAAMAQHAAPRGPAIPAATNSAGSTSRTSVAPSTAKPR